MQLGWALGPKGAEPCVKEYLVKPSGFMVAAKATEKHGISHQTAATEGLPLAKVLGMFMEDVATLQRQGGRLVCHHMERSNLI